MSYQNQGQSSGDEFKPSGNRPAQNARQSTPSALSQSHFTGGGEAADFLGLGEEVGALGASEMMAPTPAPAAPAPGLEGYDEDDEAFEDTVDTLEESDDDFEDDFDDEDDDGVHSSWVDDAPPSGKSVLPKIGVALVLGMAATAGFFAMQQGDGGEVAGVTPLAPEMNTTPDYQQRMFDRSEQPAARVEVASIEVDAPVAEGSEPEPALPADPVASLGGTSASSLVAAAGDTQLPELSGIETTAGEDEVQEATETVAGLVPDWRAGQTPPPASGFEDSSALLVVGDETGASGVDDHDYWDEIDETVAEEVGSGGRGKFLGWDEPLTGALTAAPPGAGADPLGLDGEAQAQAAGESLDAPLDEPLEDVVETLSGWEDDELATDDLAADSEMADAEAGAPDEVADLDAGTAAASEPIAAEVSESGTEARPIEVQGDVLGEGQGEGVVALATEEPELAAEEPVPQGTETAGPQSGEQETGAPLEDPVAAVEAPVAGAPSGPEAVSTDETAPGETLAIGPALPAGVEPVAVASAPESTSTTRVRVMQTADVLEQGSKGPRPATQEEMKGVWLQPEVPPMHAIVQKHKVLTPQVGEVRVVHKDGEIFQGRLYAMGEGRVWLTSDSFGQMGLDGAKVERIQRVLAGDKSDESTAGVDSLEEMESVRVKTPGGILVGKVINRDAYQTTIVTDDGARVTLATQQVEILDQNPGVTLKRATPAPPSSEGGD